MDFATAICNHCYIKLPPILPRSTADAPPPSVESLECFVLMG